MHGCKNERIHGCIHTCVWFNGCIDLQIHGRLCFAGTDEMGNAATRTGFEHTTILLLADVHHLGY